MAKRGLVFKNYLQERYSINMHILSDESQYVLNTLVKTNGKFSSYSKDTNTSVSEVLRELNQLYFEVSTDGHIYTESVFKSITFDTEKEQFHCEFTNKDTINDLKNAMPKESQFLYMTPLKGRYSLPLLMLLKDKLQMNDGSFTIPYTYLTETLLFPSSYRSTHVVEQLDKAIAEITDIKRDSPTYHIEYELNRTKSTAKSKQGKVISITFTVEWETDSDSM